LLYNDPKMKLQWPLPVSVISEKDQQWRKLEDQEAELKQKMSAGLTERAVEVL
jgi:dTDP-4-dehydrorhamnose 3,5-epimerase